MSFLPSKTRVFLCLAHTDMRKSFDKLAALVKEVMKCDPLSKDLFVFRNRAEDRMKIRNCPSMYTLTALAGEALA